MRDQLQADFIVGTDEITPKLREIRTIAEEVTKSLVEGQKETAQAFNEVAEQLAKNVEAYTEVAKAGTTFQKQQKGANEQVRNFGGFLKGATADVARFATGVAVGNLAVLGARKVLRGLISTLQDVVRTYEETRLSMEGLAVIAQAVDVDIGETTQAAIALSSKGFLRMKDSAEGLRNLLLTGFGLPESIKILQLSTDASMANRRETMSLTRQILSFSEGLKYQRIRLLDNIGMSREAALATNEHLRAAAESTDETQRQAHMTAAFNIILSDLAKYEGMAETQVSTLTGAIGRYTIAMEVAKYTLGMALTPAIIAATNVLATFAVKIAEIVTQHLPLLISAALGTGKALGYITVGIAGILDIIPWLITSILRLFGIMKTPWPAPWQIWGEGLELVNRIFDDTMKAIGKSAREGVKNIGDAAKEGAERITGLTDKEAKKREQRIEDENKRYALQLEGREATFREHLISLIKRHQDKVKQITEQIEEETENYEDKLDDLKYSYDKAIGKIEKRHAEKVETIGKQLDKEEKKWEETQKRITDKYADYQKASRELAERRMATLIGLLAEESAKREYANKEKIEMLKDMIEREGDAFEARKDRVSKIEAEEVAKAKEAHQERFDDLKEQLKKENAEVKESLRERKEEYDRDVQKTEDAHKKRLDKFEDALKEEKDILEKHQEDVEELKEEADEDDITRAKKKHKEDLRLMKKQHRENLRKINKQASELSKEAIEELKSWRKKYGATGALVGSELTEGIMGALGEIDLEPVIEALKDPRKLNEIKKASENIAKIIVTSIVVGIVAWFKRRAIWAAFIAVIPKTLKWVFLTAIPKIAWAAIAIAMVGALIKSIKDDIAKRDWKSVIRKVVTALGTATILYFAGAPAAAIAIGSSIAAFIANAIGKWIERHDWGTTVDEIVSGLRSSINRAWGRLWEIGRTMWDAISSGFRGVFDIGINVARSLRDALQDLLWKLWGRTKDIWPVGHVAWQLAHALEQIPRWQKGKIVTEPTVGILGEQGPEMVVPLRRGPIAPEVAQELRKEPGIVGQPVTVNQYITINKVEGEVDIMRVMEKAAFMYKQSGIFSRRI